MLVLVSDIHLTDESTAMNVDPSAFRVLLREILTSAAQRDAREMRVVLLGDVYDLVRTSYWHSRNVPPDDRPWGGSLDPQTAMNRKTALVEQQFGEVLDKILATPAGRALADLLGKLPRIDDKAPKVTYVVGNHDRPLNNFASLRNRLTSRLPGVQLEFATRFLAPEYGVLARHGHEWDDNCHGRRFLTEVLQKGRQVGRFDADAYKVMAIGEAVTAELMAGFIHYVERRLDLDDPADAAFLKSLKDVNNIRPMTEALAWVHWFTRQRCDKHVGIARDALVQALGGLLDCSLAKRWGELKPEPVVSGDIADYLDKAWRALKEGRDLLDLGDLVSHVSRAAAMYHRVVGTGLDDFARGAKEELDGGLSPHIQYVVYGHTHDALHDCFAAEQSGRVRMYVNTGTYLPLVERALDGKSFERSYRMMLLFFYREDEDVLDRADNGPTVDFWDGMRRKAFA